MSLKASNLIERPSQSDIQLYERGSGISSSGHTYKANAANNDDVNTQRVSQDQFTKLAKKSEWENGGRSQKFNSSEQQLNVDPMADFLSSMGGNSDYLAELEKPSPKPIQKVSQDAKANVHNDGDDDMAAFLGSMGGNDDYLQQLMK